MKLAQLSILAVLAIASQAALAQTAPARMGPGMSSAGSGSSTPGAGGGTGSGATDASSVTNVGSSLVSDSIVDVPPVPDGPSTGAAPTGEMADTGGEPEIMLIAGLLLASGGLLLRRKTSAQSL